VINNAVNEIHWQHMTPARVFESWDKLYRAIRDGVVPERDYEKLWSRETILWKLQHGELNKTDTKTVEERVKTGFAGQLLDKGDWRCEYCAFQRGCYSPYPDFKPAVMDELTDERLQKVHSAVLPYGQPGDISKVHVGKLPS
jgi:hypothetical protein